MCRPLPSRVAHLARTALIALPATACVVTFEEAPLPADLGAPDLGVDAARPDLGPLPDFGTVDAGPGDASDPFFVSVPRALPVLATTATCASLAPGEIAASVDPEGHLWTVRTSSTSGVALRVLDAWGERPETHYETRFDSILTLLAESATTASVIADGSAWRFADGARIRITTPFSLGAAASLCGSLGEDGFVLSGSRLHQREADTWLRWDGLDSVLTPDSRLLAPDGTCRRGESAVRVASGSLGFWTITATAATRTATLAGGTWPSLLDRRPLAVRDGHLLIGPSPWARYAFEDGAVRALAVGGEYAWLLAGDALLRFDGQAFDRVELGASLGTLGPNVALHPFAAGGVWATGSGRACAALPTVMVRVAGIRSGSVSEGDRLTFRARPSDPTLEVHARLNGTELTPVRVEEDGLSFSGRLDPGWSRIDLTVPGGGLERRSFIERRLEDPPSWQVDIQPIYRAHCSDANCHVAGSMSGAPDLADYAAWVMRAGAIEQRVVVRQDMPPVASRDPTWGEEAIRVIRDWLRGGLRP